jgi:sugar lactone lactonase YvrE
VCDVVDEVIYAVDLASGDRSIASSASVGSGPTLGMPYAMAIEPTGSLLVLAGGDILRVDPLTGDRELVSAAARGSGPELLGARDIDVDTRGRIFVTATGLGDPHEEDVILRIDPWSGDRVALVPPFGPGVGNGFSLAVTPGLAPPLLPSLSFPALGLLAMTLLAAGARRVLRNPRG